MSPFTVLLAVTIAYSLLLSSGECCKAESHSRGKREATPGASGAEDESDTARIEREADQGASNYDDNYKAFFKRMDVDGDGIINYREGLSFYARIDKDHDGLIEGVEFKKL